MLEQLPDVGTVSGLVAVIVGAWAARQRTLTQTWKDTAEARGARISDLEGDVERCQEELDGVRIERDEVQAERDEVIEERDIALRLSNGETYVEAVKSEVASVVESLRADVHRLEDKIDGKDR